MAGGTELFSETQSVPSTLKHSDQANFPICVFCIFIIKSFFGNIWYRKNS